MTFNLKVWAVVSPNWTSSYNKLYKNWLNFAPTGLGFRVTIIFDQVGHAKATLPTLKDPQSTYLFIFNVKNMWLHDPIISHTKSQILHRALAIFLDGCHVHHRSHPCTSSEKSTRIGTPVFKRYSVLRRLFGLRRPRNLPCRNGCFFALSCSIHI